MVGARGLWSAVTASVFYYDGLAAVGRGMRRFSKLLAWIDESQVCKGYTACIYIVHAVASRETDNKCASIYAL